jgi:hypothetical protein
MRLYAPAANRRKALVCRSEKIDGSHDPPSVFFLNRSSYFGLLICVGFQAALAAEPKRVMVLHSFGRDFKPWGANTPKPFIRNSIGNRHDLSLLTARSDDENAEVPFVEYLGALFAKRCH